MGKKLFFFPFLLVILCRRNCSKSMNDSEFRKKKEKDGGTRKKVNEFSPLYKLKGPLFCFSFGIIGNNEPKAEPDR